MDPADAESISHALANEGALVGQNEEVLHGVIDTSKA